MFGFVLGTPKDDVLKGSPEAEYIGGFRGNDILDGGAEEMSLSDLTVPINFSFLNP